MQRRTLFLGGLAGLSLLSLGLVPTTQTVPTIPPPSALFEFKNMDVRQALREIFKREGISYTIDPKVQGTVNLSLTNVSFADALASVLRQVDANYRVEGGVYQILPIHDEGSGWIGRSKEIQRPFDPTEPAVISMDSESVFIFQGETLYKVDKATMKVVGQVSLGPRRIHITY